MKRNHYKTNKVKKGIKMMAVAALSAVLLAGCGQSAAEDGRDTIANADGAGATETQRLEDTAGTEGTADNAADTEGIRQQKAEAHSWKSGLGTEGKPL